MRKTLLTHKVPSGAARAVRERTSFSKKLLFSIFFVRHLRALMPLLLARRGSNLHRLVKACPEILGIVVKPYVAANLEARTRITRLVDRGRSVTDFDVVPRRKGSPFFRSAK
jgi:uncharacterized protein VirK/YbjX